MTGVPLTQNQKVYAATLAQTTGLNPQTVGAWELGEESSTAAQNREAANNNDWLNVGYTDSGTDGGNDAIWNNPVTAAKATAGWLKGQNTVPNYGTASSGIQDILKTVGETPAQQIAAIGSSGWASSGYGGTLADLLPDVQGFNPSGTPTVPPTVAPKQPTLAAPVVAPAPQPVPTPPAQTGSLYNTLSKLENERQNDLKSAGLQTTPIDNDGWNFLKSLADGAAQQTATQPPTVAQTSTGSTVPKALAKPATTGVKAAIAAADTMASNKYNYEWGGGHNPSFSPAHGVGHGSGVGTGYDCSGAVSAILHSVGLVNEPMVAQQYMNYGSPGAGKGPNDITIYASPTHVFMQIGGKYFGTSYNNPGGGAGWFADADTTGFTVRHVTVGG